MVKKVVVIGGGTGSFNILKGLKKYASFDEKDFPIEISAIITMMDSGGSSGMLRDELGILPPGDIRRALVALSDETEIMKALFQYRFGSCINEHSFGNLFLAALTDLLGSEKEAINQAHKILKVNGTVVPVTLEKADLCARLNDGSILKKENDICAKRNNIKIQKVFLSKKVKVNPEAIDVIKKADAIIIGPGDLYTSIIPNFLVKGVAKAINESKAIKIYNCNIMTRYNETDNFSVKDYAKKINEFVNVDLITFSKTKFSKKVLKEYMKEKSKPVKESVLKNAFGFDLATSPIIRHDSEKSAKILLNIIFEKSHVCEKIPVRI